ncbi:hypothetical protein BX600DRAFT_512657 [Xylariales sp. PMI_506]|nr:hypothetical protein BX600DRAFT_512657 [Xylariales sp. PMI_506]
MYSKVILASAILSSVLVTGKPLAGSQNVPITDAEWAALKANGVTPRSPANVNVPITDDEWAALEANGLSSRSNGLAARDSVINCGMNVSGDKTIGGNHIGWVPVDQFRSVASEFCRAYVGTDIALNHETSDTYPITLTNQGDSSQVGPPGNIVFAIYNLNRSPSYMIDYNTCYNAMLAPLNAYLDQNNQNGWGDKCYGSVNHDYEGGYESVDGIGAFGSEVYKA